MLVLVERIGFRPGADSAERGSDRGPILGPIDAVGFRSGSASAERGSDRVPISRRGEVIGFQSCSENRNTRGYPVLSSGYRVNRYRLLAVQPLSKAFPLFLVILDDQYPEILVSHLQPPWQK